MFTNISYVWYLRECLPDNNQPIPSNFKLRNHPILKIQIIFFPEFICPTAFMKLLSFFLLLTFIFKASLISPTESLVTPQAIRVSSCPCVCLPGGAACIAICRAVDCSHGKKIGIKCCPIDDSYYSWRLKFWIWECWGSLLSEMIELNDMAALTRTVSFIKRDDICFK